MLSFWGAVAMPMLYLPLLATGLDTPSGLARFLALFVIHGLALLGGRNHRRTEL